MESIQTQFENEARRIYFSALESFQFKTKGINRKTDEQIFRELCHQQFQSLRSELEGTAQSLLTRHQHAEQIASINQQLQHSIQDFLHQFVQKTR